MHLGIIGLGRMGANMARRLLQGGHKVVVYNRTPQKVQELAAEGAIPAESIEDLIQKLPKPAIVWLMLPVGDVLENHITIVEGLLEKDDILVDGGNSYYKDDLIRYERLKSKGIKYVDAGVSGGIWGLEIGYCTMVGGDKEVFNFLEPVFKTLAPVRGYLYCGKAGAGHFVKMIHNGVEYAMMEAYGEGFDLLENSPYAEELNFAEVSHLWNQGSVIRSWLLELLESAFEKDPKLKDLKGYVEDSGEGRWTVLQAVESGVSAPVIAQSLFKRFESRQQDVFSNKVNAALRNEFGGHQVQKK